MVLIFGWYSSDHRSILLIRFAHLQGTRAKAFTTKDTKEKPTSVTSLSFGFTFVSLVSLVSFVVKLCFLAGDNRIRLGTTVPVRKTGRSRLTNTAPFAQALTMGRIVRRDSGRGGQGVFSQRRARLAAPDASP
jgi:hypothetical protein